jgi:hypothetical protein
MQDHAEAGAEPDRGPHGLCSLEVLRSLRPSAEAPAIPECNSGFYRVTIQADAPTLDLPTPKEIIMMIASFTVDRVLLGGVL